MRPYETMVVVSNTADEESAALIKRLETVVESEGGKLDTTHDWGMRKLAYPIRRQADGRYYLMEYQAEPAAVHELERTMRITESVLRYISVQQDHTGLPVERERERDGEFAGGDRYRGDRRSDDRRSDDRRSEDRPRREAPLSEFRSTGVTEELASATPAAEPAVEPAPAPAKENSDG